MRFIIEILALFFLCPAKVSCQYIATWKSYGHSQYYIQQSIDKTIFNTIGTINSKVTDTSFSFTVSGPTYYYRVVAGGDTSKNLFVYETLGIEADSIFHPQITFENSIKIIVTDDQLKIVVSSQRDELVEYMLMDISSRVLRGGQWFINKGLNSMYLPFNYAHGIYIILFQSGYDRIIKKIMK